MRLLFIWLFWLLPSIVWGTEYCIEKVIDCKTLSTTACSDEVLTALGHNGTTMKLKAETAMDTVHGYVTITWAEPPDVSRVCITYYDKEEGGNKKHKSTFKKLSIMPSQNDVKTLLDNLVIP